MAPTLHGQAADDGARHQHGMGGAQHGACEAQHTPLAGEQGEERFHGITDEAVADMGLGRVDALGSMQALTVDGSLPRTLQRGQVTGEQVGLQTFELATQRGIRGEGDQLLVDAGAAERALHGALQGFTPAGDKGLRGGRGQDRERNTELLVQVTQQRDALGGAVEQGLQRRLVAVGGHGRRVKGPGGLLFLQGDSEDRAGATVGQVRARHGEVVHGLHPEWFAGSAPRACRHWPADRATRHSGSRRDRIRWCRSVPAGSS